MKNYFLFLFFIAFILSNQNSYAQSSKTSSIEIAVDQLKEAMLSGDRLQLEKIASDHLSYGHSGGHIEGKAEFVEKIASGKSDFVSIEITEQTIHITGKTAIVRHVFNAVTNDGGKPGNIKLKILLVFSKEQGQWRMLARQAVKA
jgi:ketosteroid isomerase-like protein